MSLEKGRYPFIVTNAKSRNQRNAKNQVQQMTASTTRKPDCQGICELVGVSFESRAQANVARVVKSPKKQAILVENEVHLHPDMSDEEMLETDGSSASSRASSRASSKSSGRCSGSGHKNVLQFVGSKKHGGENAPGLTRSAGTLNLLLGRDAEVPTINEYMDSWSPFKERPESQGNLKRSASRSELSPFVNDPDILRRWVYKKRDDQPVDAVSSTPGASAHMSKHRKTLDRSFSAAKPDQVAFTSSGLVSKMRSNLLPPKINTPETPVKKSPLSRDTENLSLQDSPVHFNSFVSGIFDSTLASPLGTASSRFQTTNMTTASLTSIKSRKTKASRVLNNNVLTDTLQQFTDELYGIYDEGSFFSDYAPPTAPAISVTLDPGSPLHNTPTKSHSFTQPSSSSAGMHRSHRSINAKVNRASSSASPSRETSQTNPDSHLATKFSNVGTIGSGQFSEVYQVTFLPTNTRYAVKSMRPNKYNSTKRILQEIKILSEISETTLDHEGKEYVLNFISSWTYGGFYYVMTEFCENGNLDKFLQEQVSKKKTRLEDWRIWKIIIELCLALRFIHESCQIAHLDLKPANVLITFEGNLKLGDFGIATKLPVQDVGFENEGDREYIAPEIISEGIYDFRADIFSLGLMIVEIAANVVLPDNGHAWHKLRSGDLSDAGNLSSAEIHSESLFSETKTSTMGTNVHSGEVSDKLDLRLDQVSKIPAWVPKFLIDGVSLEKMVRRMIQPNYTKRPTADEILHTEECEYVEMTRKAGAIIQEDDFGPKPDLFMETSDKCASR
ncbi:LAMI_0G07888g1_1 [Lachancea mirantina]|uniref:LAMI_0G07888g1_1 n=1 Tax=Lachancea mirantina TaxID=1230905 RepID=A0A1G4K9X0_9SACH|nr:LAMI_0G07888g1_1 [Lachancea mirantina]